MNILDEIITNKKREVQALKREVSLSTIERSPLFKSPVNSLSGSIKNSDFGIIAEFKRKSPSAGDLNNSNNIVEYVDQYIQADIAGLSVLTDKDYFGTTTNDFLILRNAFDLPMLRKEFIIDEFQLFESKAMGADCILLIASVLSKEELLHFSIIAKTLGMEVLVEVHKLSEINKVPDNIDIIGVNNRDLDRQITDIETSKQLSDYLPMKPVRITESGIKSAEELKALSAVGYQGALIGESIVKSGNPKEVITTLTRKIAPVCS